MVSLPNVDVYPKELVLRDATKVVLRPLRAEDKVRLLRHRRGAPARRHIGKLRIVVDSDDREKGLGRRLIRELVDIAVDLGLHKVSFELVAHRESPPSRPRGAWASRRWEP